VALPIKGDAHQVIAVVGVAYADDRELDQDTLMDLSGQAEAYLRQS
jgi:hypothetical protein